MEHFLDENIADNPFFLALKKRFSDVYEKAQDNQAIIAVPQRKSLPSGSVSLRLIESHIFRSSPYFRGQYISLDDRTVDIENNCITTGEGYPEQRCAHILFEEKHYNKEYKAFRVLCTDIPLEGEIAQSLEPSTWSAPSDLSYESAREWLMKLDIPAQEVLKTLDDHIRQFNQTFIIVQGFEAAAITKIRGMVATAAKGLIVALPSLHGFPRVVLNQLLESYAIGNMHSHIFEGICRIYEKDDDLLDRLMVKLTTITQSDLGVDKKFHYEPIRSIALLKQLNTKLTPMDKVLLIKDTITTLTEEVTSRVSDAPDALTTDDLLPLVVHILIKSKIEHVCSNVHYMETFLTSEFASEELGFHMVTFHAAVEFLKSKEAQYKLKPKERSQSSRTYTNTYWKNLRAQTESSQKNELLNAESHPTTTTNISNTTTISTTTNSTTTNAQTETRRSRSLFVPTVIDSSPEAEAKPGMMGDFLAKLQQTGDVSSSSRRF